MNEQQVNVIVEFWKKTTGRVGPKKITFEMLPTACGVFCFGDIILNPIWADDETVFHELAHLEQWQDGRLSYEFAPIVSPGFPKETLQDAYHCYRSPSKSLFEGKLAHELPYRERPVEIDARRIAKERLELFRLTNPWPVVS